MNLRHCSATVCVTNANKNNLALIIWHACMLVEIKFHAMKSCNAIILLYAHIFSKHLQIYMNIYNVHLTLAKPLLRKILILIVQSKALAASAKNLKRWKIKKQKVAIKTFANISNIHSHKTIYLCSCLCLVIQCI